MERAAGGDQPSGVVLEEPTSATGSSGGFCLKLCFAYFGSIH